MVSMDREKQNGKYCQASGKIPTSSPLVSCSLDMYAAPDPEVYIGVDRKCFKRRRGFLAQGPQKAAGRDRATEVSAYFFF